MSYKMSPNSHDLTGRLCLSNREFHWMKEAVQYFPDLGSHTCKAIFMRYEHFSADARQTPYFQASSQPYNIGPIGWVSLMLSEWVNSKNYSANSRTLSLPSHNQKKGCCADILCDSKATEGLFVSLRDSLRRTLYASHETVMPLLRCVAHLCMLRSAAGQQKASLHEHCNPMKPPRSFSGCWSISSPTLSSDLSMCRSY